MSGWIELVVMDTRRPFRNAVGKHARGADMVFDKLHIMWHLSNTPDQIRHDEYKRLQGAGQSYPKGQRHTPPSHHENLSLERRQALKMPLAANMRLNTADLLKKSFGQLRSYRSDRGARASFERLKRACAGSGWHRTRRSCG